jgi:CheY-like chemotaxis protein
MPITLLLADDSVLIQKLVGLSFANEDIEIITVDNGDDAVSRANECKPDIILADVVMPGKNGYEVCSAIRNNPELSAIPVLLLTGTFEAFDEARAREVGATGHITKPFEAQVLVDRVTEILEQHRQAAPVAATAPAGDDFFDENIDGLASDASATPSPVEPSAADSFAFGAGGAGSNSLDRQSLSSPLDDAGSETVAMVSGSDLGDLLDGAGGDRTVTIMPESFGNDSIEQSASIDSSPNPAPPTDPGQTILVDDFLDSPEPGSNLVGETSRPTITDESGGTAIGSLNLKGVPAPSPMDAMDPPVAVAEPSTLATDTDALDIDGLSFASQPAMPPVDLDVPGGDATVLADDLFSSGPDLESGPDNSENALTEPTASSSPLSDGLDIDFAGGSGAESSVPDNVNDYDVSSSDLNVDLMGESSSWRAGIPAGVQTAPEPISMTPEADPSTPPSPPAPVRDAVGSTGGSVSTRPEMTAEMGDRINDTLEKVAWEAFSDLSDDIVRQLMKRVEQIVWEVVPQLAETLIREEIRRLQGEEAGEGAEDAKSADAEE